MNVKRKRFFSQTNSKDDERTWDDLIDETLNKVNKELSNHTIINIQEDFQYLNLRPKPDDRSTWYTRHIYMVTVFYYE